VAVTSGPWLLTTLVLVLLRISAVRSGVPAIDEVEVVITVVYAVVLVLTAPLNIVFSRCASDRVYERHPESIAVPLRRALAATLLATAVAGSAAMLVLGVDVRLAVGGAALTVIVGGQWLLLSAAGGLSSPVLILRAFAIGAPVSVVAAAALSRGFAAGYLYGFALGQAVTLTWLLFGVLRGLPREEDPDASLGPSLSKYRLLGLSALVLQGGIWIDKLVVYFFDGRATASAYAACAALAWLCVVPASAYLFVQVETSFYRAFRGFYDGIERGAPLRDLDRAADDIDHIVARTLRTTVALQLAVTALAMAAARPVIEALGLANLDPWTVRLLLAGGALHLVCVSATLLLCYFDFQREALVAGLVLLVGNGLLTAGFHGQLPAGAGYLVAASLSAATAVLFLRARMATLLRDTYQSQPYGTE
jgi:polysaccharide biosynthesis protein PelG